MLKAQMKNSMQLIPSIFVLALMTATAGALKAQVASQAAGQESSPYHGVSHPPADDVIETSTIPEAKPPAGKPLVAPAPPAPVYAQPPAPVQAYQPPPPVQQAEPSNEANMMGDGTDAGLVRVGSNAPQVPVELNQRAAASQPTYAAGADEDIVHPQPLRPGELEIGTSIRVRLMDRLSTAETERGEPFRSRVATDVMQGGQVIIPAGTEIDGRVSDVSTGHVGGRGTMRLDPQLVMLPDGTRFRLHAELTSTPGSRTRVVGEGTIQPGSRLKRDGIEYGSAIGAGAGMGAIVAGPVGALTGSLIGAGAITVHLMVSHPQATLEPGSTLMFMLTDPLYLAPQAASGN
jgi:hypothetical protein